MRKLLVAGLFSSFAAFMLSACTDAGLCVRGELGCACLSTGACSEGKCNEDDMCIETVSMQEDGGGTDLDAGAPPDGSRDLDCPDDDLMTACEGFCEAFCETQEIMCVTSRCEPDDCMPGGQVIQVCLDNATTAAAARSLCEQEADWTCREFGFENDKMVFQSACFRADPRCTLDPERGCSDTCGSLAGGVGGQFAGDEVCDDGSKGDPAACPRGTDCTDCGALPCSPLGGACTNNGECCDFFEGTGFCVELEGGTCLRDCTEGRSCPDAFECLPTMDMSFVCVPMNR